MSSKKKKSSSVDRLNERAEYLTKKISNSNLPNDVAERLAQQRDKLSSARKILEKPIKK